MKTLYDDGLLTISEHEGTIHLFRGSAPNVIGFFVDKKTLVEALAGEFISIVEELKAEFEDHIARTRGGNLRRQGEAKGYEKVLKALEGPTPTEDPFEKEPCRSCTRRICEVDSDACRISGHWDDKDEEVK